MIGKKSAVGDRPAVRRKEEVISWDRMPFACKTMRSVEDVELQRAMVSDRIFQDLGRVYSDVLWCSSSRCGTRMVRLPNQTVMNGNRRKFTIY